MVRRTVALTLLLLASASRTLAQSPPDPQLDAALAKMGAYIAAYGEKASLIVAIEKYTQSVMFEGAPAPSRPRQLVAEFAIVRAGAGWIGFRDVVEVDGRTLSDRRDRLTKLFTDRSSDSSEITRIANESARFNAGPISRNFNVPTTALFFFQPASLERFAFTRKGVKKIDGVTTWEIAFRETRSPTLVMTRSGHDVPMDGTLWVVPVDGTVVRTRIRMKNFADTMASPVQAAPPMGTPLNPSSNAGGRVAPRTDPSLSWTPIDSSAETEVTYRRHPDIGIWLPATMEELYVGPITLTVSPTAGRASTRATYTEFKQFGTDVKINVPK